MIFLQNAFLKFNDQKIFDDISFSFSDSQKIGLVGINGSGKTTLLKTLAGYITLDSGVVGKQQNKKIAYMPQEMILESKKTIFDEAFSVFDIEDLEFQTQSKTEKVLIGLGFKKETFDQPIGQLSVGWKMRLVLAKLLLQNANFYLFDEPTNHLDIVAKNWFFEFLKNAQFGFLLVSHDKYFLDNLCDYIFELDKAKGFLYDGNYTNYLIKKEHRLELLKAKYVKQQKEIAKKERTIERFRAKSSKARMVKSMEKQLEKIDRIELGKENSNIQFSFSDIERSSRIVLEFKNLRKSFDSKEVFRNISGIIERGEKVALISPNGAGKTTLFNLLGGKYPEESPNIVLGNNVQYAVFEQDQIQSLNPKNSIFEQILYDYPQVPEQSIRNILGTFLFSGEDIHKKIEVLSGGEKNRVGMVKVLLKNANFLLLDEPTNHLDIQSKEILIKALQTYKGTIFFVSHDRDFVNSLATRIFELTPTGLLTYSGDYDSYLLYKKSEATIEDSSKENSQKEEHKKSEFQKIRKNLFHIEKIIKDLEKKIDLYQKKIEKSYEIKEYTKLVNKLQKYQKELDEYMHEWENLQRKIENI